MKIVISILIAAAGLVTAGSSWAADMPALMKKYNCNGCHAMDKKVIGPSFEKIAGKYKNDPTAKNMLVAKLLTGGGGVWGSMPMPPNPMLGRTDAAALVSFILELNPGVSRTSFLVFD